MTVLHTERLTLRPFVPADYPFYARLCADPAVMRHIRAGHAWDAGQSWRDLAMMLGHWQLRGYGPFAIATRTAGELIGRAVLWHEAAKSEVEVGWFVVREYWGQGYATEAARAVIDYAFTALGQPGVTASIQPANAASMRVATRLGFVLAEPSPPDQPRVSAIYRLDREVWAASSRDPR